MNSKHEHHKHKENLYRELRLVFLLLWTNKVHKMEKFHLSHLQQAPSKASFRIRSSLKPPTKTPSMPYSMMS